MAEVLSQVGIGARARQFLTLPGRGNFVQKLAFAICLLLGLSSTFSLGNGSSCVWFGMNDEGIVNVTKVYGLT